ncbi:hypothetical protein WH52_01965 [Tenacibaculum holothuriorum]|uniref:Peptidase E n=1 Tax=Tenacibaculum holothuriorum TaxID=1635173 RepID=A0A1Y2PG15_9FLAO|nr:DUF6702 family protein [Tenacibaculum holothuriorum]OSY89424.1 hypothetical protein WH52_01965 [Tenacibaculum holothuriorum]
MKKTVFILLLLPLFAFSVHKYYLALTEIEYDAKNKSVQMIMNVFMDDFELAINKDFNLNLELASNKEPKNVDEHFFKYLKQHFKVKINNKENSYRFIGKEYDGNIIFFYLEIDDVNEVKSIEIQNDILVLHFPDQQNLVKAKINNKRKSLFLDKKNDKGLLNF